MISTRLCCTRTEGTGDGEGRAAEASKAALGFIYHRNASFRSNREKRKTQRREVEVRKKNKKKGAKRFISETAFHVDPSSDLIRFSRCLFKV